MHDAAHPKESTVHGWKYVTRCERAKSTNLCGPAAPVASTYSCQVISIRYSTNSQSELIESTWVSASAPAIEEAALLELSTLSVFEAERCDCS